MANVEINDGELEAYLHDPEGPVAEAVEKYAYNVENTAKVLVSAHGTGRWYTQLVVTLKKGVPRGTPGRLLFYGSRPPHQASAPGMPPASDTGFLRSSIGHRMNTDNSADVYCAAPYANYVELGTRYMDPRPFLRPALAAGMKEPIE